MILMILLQILGMTSLMFGITTSSLLNTTKCTGIDWNKDERDLTVFRRQKGRRIRNSRGDTC